MLIMMDTLNVRRMSERAIEKQKDMYACFIDYRKAFDTVRHEPLIDLLNAVMMYSYSQTYTGNKK